MTRKKRGGEEKKRAEQRQKGGNEGREGDSGGFWGFLPRSPRCRGLGGCQDGSSLSDWRRRCSLSRCRLFLRRCRVIPGLFHMPSRQVPAGISRLRYRLFIGSITLTNSPGSAFGVGWRGLAEEGLVPNRLKRQRRQVQAALHSGIS